MVAAEQFHQWYPQYQNEIEIVLRNSCSTQYEQYLNRTPGFDPEYQLFHDPSAGSSETAPLVACLLNGLPENVKAAMATAGVILGLLPTILALLGSSSIDTAVLSTIGRRPFLSLCLAIGSPAVTPLRLSQYSKVRNELEGAKQTQYQRIKYPEYKAIGRIIVSVVEYAVALGAVANITMASYQLGIQTICSYATQIIIQPLVWALTIEAIHIGCTIAVSLCTRIIPGHSELPVTTGKSSRGKQTWSAYLWSHLVREFTPCVQQKAVQVELIPESYLFLFFAWCTSTGTVVHIVYGTMVLSSALFISAQDAFLVTLRYILSVVCCRAVLAYELAGLRQKYALRRTDYGRL